MHGAREPGAVAWRRRVLVPIASLGEAGGRAILELVADPAGVLGAEGPDVRALGRCGLGVATASALRAVRAFALPPVPAARRRPWLPPPVLYIARPPAGIDDDAGGAALGIALAVLMYRGVCPQRCLLASGCLQLSGSEEASVGAAGARLSTLLAAAASMERQVKPLLYLVPALMGNEPVAARLADAIAGLARLNVRVEPVSTLREAVSVCRTLGEARQGARALASS